MTEDLWARPSRFRHAEGMAVATFLIACTAITVLTTAGIVIVLGAETIRFFAAAKLGLGRFLFGTDVEPPNFGILPLVWGTFLIAVGSSLIALPVGLLSAIY